MTDPVTTETNDVADLVDEQIPETTEQTSEDVTEVEEVSSPEQSAELIDAAFAQEFRYPTSMEASPDGRFLVYLQPSSEGKLQLWIVETEDGAEPQLIELPFVPVEDRDPDTGRLIRGPQFNPDSSRIAVTGKHPDGDRTSVWIVPVAAAEAAPEVIAASADQSDSASDPDEFGLEVADDDGMAVPPDDSDLDSSAADEADLVETDLDELVVEDEDADLYTPEEAVEDNDIFVPSDDTAAVVTDEPADEFDLEVADDDGMLPPPEPEDDIDDLPVASSGESVEAETVFEDSDQLDVMASAAPVDTAQPYLLADHDGADRSPRWSPDGEIIAFVSTIDGRDVISLASPDDPGSFEMLTWSRDHSREPQWSRDGKFLGFLRPISGGEGYHDIWSFSLEAGELTNLTGEKAATIRHSIEWVPGRNLIAYVTVENDWLGISVVNADNKAGWVVTRESGDKTEPRFAQDESRLVYLRNEGFTTALCERSLHSSAAVALDPGEGVASFGRWAGQKRVAYAFSAPQKPVGFFVQENSAKAERTAIQPDLGASTRDMPLVQPQPLEFEVGPEETFSGLEYRAESVQGETPGIVYLPDGALTTRRGSFQMEEQAMASSGLAVFTPVLHGASGFGAAIENDLREFAGSELEVTDIAEAAAELGKLSNVDASKIAVVGHGFGGALALVAAGARPGSFGAVVAIDPIVEWSTELANADVTWRNWVTERFGMPFTHADTYALRTPATFSAVIDVPLVLVRTANAPEHRVAQYRALAADLDEMGVAYTELEAPAEPITATLRRVSQWLANELATDAPKRSAGSDTRADDI